jgi:hypothetical protein
MRRHNLPFFVGLFSMYLVILASGECFLPAARAQNRAGRALPTDLVEKSCLCRTSPCNDSDEGSSWIFEPSYFSHDPKTGERVVQYAPLPSVYRTVDPTYRESGFHYTEQFLRGIGSSFDALHMVQTWGQGDQIRPYGEWQYPYRAGATPYGPWGNPQGPWTLPFDSWQNPYGLGRLPNPPWPVFPFNPGVIPVPFGNSNSQGMPGIGFGAGGMPYGNDSNVPSSNMGNIGDGNGE